MPAVLDGQAGNHRLRAPVSGTARRACPMDLAGSRGIWLGSRVSLERKVDEPSSPLDIYDNLGARYRNESDGAIVAELRLIAPLPHEEDPRWLSDWRTEPIWGLAYRFNVLVGEVCRRKLKEALSLVLERVCCGDPGEMYRNTPDIICDTAGEDWEFVLDLCNRAVSWPQSGARLWAVETLGSTGYFPVEADAARREAIVRARYDHEKLVRESAELRLTVLDEEIQRRTG